MAAEAAALAGMPTRCSQPQVSGFCRIPSTAVCASERVKLGAVTVAV
jgi:hypothetical protein